VTFPFSRSLRWKTSESHLTYSLHSSHALSHYVLSGLIPKCHSHLSYQQHSLVPGFISFLHGLGNLIAICLPFFCQYTSSHPVLVEVATLSEACKPDSLYINSKPCAVQCLAILSPIMPLPVIDCTKPHFSVLIGKALLSLCHLEVFLLLVSVSNSLTRLRLVYQLQSYLWFKTRLKHNFFQNSPSQYETTCSLTLTLFQTLAHIILNVNIQVYKGRPNEYCVIKTKEFLLLVKYTWIFFFFFLHWHRNCHPFACEKISNCKASLVIS
jgi:hypothetical protein